LRSDGPADGGANTRADAIAEPRTEPRADGGANIRADAIAEPRAEPRADDGANIRADVTGVAFLAVSGLIAPSPSKKTTPVGLAAPNCTFRP
jgi:hypothetical protein